MASPIKRLVQLVLDRAAALRTERGAKAMLKRVGKATTALKGTFGKLGLAVSAAFAVRKVIDFANAVDESRRTLIRLTGAQGAALRTLQRDTQAVFATVPESIGDVSIAIGNLNTLLGITGTELQTVTSAALDFARANDVDVTQATLVVGQLINRYGLNAEQAIPFMDRLTVAGQLTGASVTELAERLKEAGPILSQLGFTINEQIALFAEFERRGIKGTEAAAGMNRVFTNLAKEGLTDGASAFAEFIKRIKEADSDLAAGAIAADAFGQRAGAKMAVDIRAGAFEIDELTESLQNADGALAATEEASRTAGDALKTSANALKADLVPALQVATNALAFIGTMFIAVINGPINLWQRIIDETILRMVEFRLGVATLNLMGRRLLRLDTTEAQQDVRNLTQLVFDLGVAIDKHANKVEDVVFVPPGASDAFDITPESTGTPGPAVSVADAEAARKAAAAEAIRITQSLRNETEIFNDTLNTLREHLDADRISQDTFNRGLAAAKEAFVAATEKADEEMDAVDRVAEALGRHATAMATNLQLAGLLGEEFDALGAKESSLLSTLRVLADEGIPDTDARFQDLVGRLDEVRRAMSLVSDESESVGEAASIAGELVGAAFGASIGPLASGKAKQNAILAAEQLAQGFAALLSPFTAATAAGHFTAAAKFGAIATAWQGLSASLGGAGGGSGPNVAGKGGGAGGASFGSNGPGSAGSQVEGGPEVHIHLIGEGFDAVNPRVQRVVAGAMQQVEERFGRNTRVRIHRGGG